MEYKILKETENEIIFEFNGEIYRAVVIEDDVDIYDSKERLQDQYGVMKEVNRMGIVRCIRNFVERRSRKLEEEHRVEMAKNTLKYWPDIDLSTFKSVESNDDEFVYEDNKLVKAYGVYIEVDNPECTYFALRRKSDMRLLTTFDFVKALDYKDEIVYRVYNVGFPMNGGYHPGVTWCSLKDFLKFYLKNTDDRDVQGELVIVDDTPEGY